MRQEYESGLISSGTFCQNVNFHGHSNGQSQGQPKIYIYKIDKIVKFESSTALVLNIQLTCSQTEAPGAKTKTMQKM